MLPITLSGLTLHTATHFDRLLLDFPEILVPRFQSTIIKHGVEHQIVNQGHPTFSRPRRLYANKFAAAKAEFTKWRKQASYVVPTLRGLHLYTLFLNRKVDGDHAATTDCLTTCLQMTDTRFQFTHCWRQNLFQNRSGSWVSSDSHVA